jgi:geranylgeranyl reductase family protein
MQYDLLVIGAGPAGSAAARTAALQGLSVALVDRAEFPRDKVCGDGLIADALQAIAALGLSSRVRSRATTVSGVQLYAPNGSLVPLRGECLCVPRQILDDTLREAAVEAGATFLAPFKALEPVVENAVVTGARFRHQHTRHEATISARLTLLATGAAAEPLVKFGVCRRTEASATAARVYVNVPSGVASSLRDLVISFDASICPGYGWIFPSTDSTLNIGVGFFYDAWRLPVSRNVRTLLDAFLSTFPPAAELVRQATSISPLRGAPLRTAMAGATFARAGLLVIGEAAGLTYSLTGEGIGKAMESGMLAADLAVSHLRNADTPLERIASAYAGELTRRYARKFRGYRRAQAWMNSRRLANFLAKRANAGTFVRGQLEGMFADRVYPQRLLSPLGLARAILT